MSTSRRHLLLGATLALCAGLACGGGGGGGPTGGGYGGNGTGDGNGGPSGDVAMRDNFFQPAQIIVDAGTTLTWANQGQATHSATPDDGEAWDEAEVASGGIFSVRFDEPGEYPYHCRFHGSAGGGGMAGTVIVE